MEGYKANASHEIGLLNPYFSNPAKDYVYKSKIDALGKTFGGLLIIKKLGEQHHTIAITTEMGNTLFDFEFQGKDFKINRIIPEMDKKLLINVLKRDFFALIQENPQHLTTY
ncbi:MAG: hypothetical protein WBM83_16760, partial [Flavobacteriaceae bacterium]